MEEVIRFGPAGNSDSFRNNPANKGTLDVPAYLETFGLNAFEYQCGRGVRISQEKCRAFGALAAERDIRLSVHAPYYITLSGLDDTKRLRSVDYVLQSAEAVTAMGGTRVILHAGSCGKQTRESALLRATDTLGRCVEALDQNGFSEVVLCPETMGKIGQLGSLEEVLSLCEIDARLIPCIDFGHLNARTRGEVTGRDAYAAILDAIDQRLGTERMKKIHVHFSKIEYTAGGEKRHLTFEDEVFGPDPDPLLQLFCERGMTPTVICESDGTQAEDAAWMMQYYHSLQG